MTDPDPADEALARRAARANAGPAPGQCPDANVLVRLAEGRSTRPERGLFEAHLAGCEACRETVATLAAWNLQTAVRPPGSGRRSFAGIATVVVCVLVAAGLIWLWDLHRANDPGNSDDRLYAFAAELRSRQPTLFADFEPLGRAERLGPSPRLQRGGIALLAPAGKVLDPRPEFRWERAPAVTEWRVTVSQIDGTPLWSERSAEPALSWPTARPPLVDGAQYLCEVVGTGPLGRAEAHGTVTVATTAERTAFAAVRAELSAASNPLRAVALAQLAIRRGLIAEAESVLRARLQHAPEDRLARETLFFVLGQLGAVEAANLGIAADPVEGR